MSIFNCQLMEEVRNFLSSDLFIINIVINIIPHRQKSINHGQERHCFRYISNMVLPDSPKTIVLMSYEGVTSAYTHKYELNVSAAP